MPDPVARLRDDGRCCPVTVPRHAIMAGRVRGQLVAPGARGLIRQGGARVRVTAGTLHDIRGLPMQGVPPLMDAPSPFPPERPDAERFLFLLSSGSGPVLA